jgi:hypothetical protein
LTFFKKNKTYIYFWKESIYYSFPFRLLPPLLAAPVADGGRPASFSPRAPRRGHEIIAWYWGRSDPELHSTPPLLLAYGAAPCGRPASPRRPIARARTPRRLTRGPPCEGTRQTETSTRAAHIPRLLASGLVVSSSVDPPFDVQGELRVPLIHSCENSQLYYEFIHHIMH